MEESGGEVMTRFVVIDGFVFNVYAIEFVRPDGDGTQLYLKTVGPVRVKIPLKDVYSIISKAYR